MNATLKAICGLLKKSDTDIQIAAARVLEEIQPREVGVSKALGETAVATKDVKVANALLRALEQNPHEQAIRHVLALLERGRVDTEAAYGAIAGAGNKAVSVLKQAYPKSIPHVQCAIVAIMPYLRTEQAFSFLVDSFYCNNVDILKAGIQSLREQVSEFNKKQTQELFSRVKTALAEKRTDGNQAACSALIICLGILGDPRAKSLLLDFICKDHDEIIRRHALGSLSQLEYSGEGHGDLMDALMPLLEDDNSDIVRISVEVLRKLKPRRKDSDALRKLLKSHHSLTQSFAVEALGRLNTITHARTILSFLLHQDRNLHNAAFDALSHMSCATEVLLQAFHDKAGHRTHAHRILQVLHEKPERIKAEHIKDVVKRLYEFLETGDSRVEIYREALLLIDGDALRQSVISRVSAARKRQDYERIRDCLRLLKGTEHMTPELRFTLAVSKLKTSDKEISRSFRQSDYCLELIGRMLGEDHKAFVRTFLADKDLAVEDLFYVGYHFSEKLNEERRFGEDVLRHVVKKWPRSSTAKAAREKLKVEGH